jgi:hypothetical protein
MSPLGMTPAWRVLHRRAISAREVGPAAVTDWVRARAVSGSRGRYPASVGRAAADMAFEVIRPLIVAPASDRSDVIVSRRTRTEQRISQGPAGEGSRQG